MQAHLTDEGLRLSEQIFLGLPSGQGAGGLGLLH